MNFRVDRWSAAALRSSLVILTTVGALLLSSCGGGGQSSQTKRFKPTRMIVFGDESSLLLPPSTPNGIDARKYTNNGFDQATNSTLDCSENRLWVQSLALEYSLVFAECNPAAATPTAQMRATAGGKVADVVTAVDAFLASTPGNKPVPTDLITMMAGTNDVLELYDRVTNSANPAPLLQGAAVAEIQRRAELLAAQINRLINLDNTLGRVMYSTIPEVNLTPFGRRQSSTGQSLLQLLTNTFNDRFRGKITINGRSVGFLDTANQFINVVRDVDRGGQPNGIINDRDPVCGVQPVLSCTPSTLVTGATVSNYLWADDTRFSYAAHNFIGVDAVDLARSLPW
jgi:hypothetical protein